MPVLNLGLQSLSVGGSLTISNSVLQLVNDNATPGNNYLYGTNSSGVKAWIPTSGLQIILRQGTDAERQTVIFAEGEPIWTTDLETLWVGDGTTLGGISPKFNTIEVLSTLGATVGIGSIKTAGGIYAAEYIIATTLLQVSPSTTGSDYGVVSNVSYDSEGGTGTATHTIYGSEHSGAGPTLSLRSGTTSTLSIFPGSRIGGSEHDYSYFTSTNGNHNFHCDLNSGAGSFTPRFQIAKTQVTSNVPLIYKSYTVATLPTASSFTYGIVFVSDATNAAGANIGSAPTGGGSVKRAVYSDGSAWLLL